MENWALEIKKEPVDLPRRSCNTRLSRQTFAPLQATRTQRSGRMQQASSSQKVAYRMPDQKLYGRLLLVEVWVQNREY